MRVTKAQQLQNIQEPITSSRRIANNTLEIIYSNGNKAIRLHNTDIITFTPEGNIILSSGGWRTLTTKARINEFSPVKVFQKDFTWYAGGQKVKFYDGITFNNRGELVQKGE